jgi:hypothetical protein
MPNLLKSVDENRFVAAYSKTKSFALRNCDASTALIVNGAHKDAITALTVSGNFLVTAAKNAALMWDVNGGD